MRVCPATEWQQMLEANGLAAWHRYSNQGVQGSMIQDSPWGASPAVVVEAKEVAAWLASRVLPVAGPPDGQPVVEGARLQVVHHRLVPPHTVGEGDGQPAACTLTLNPKL